MFRNISRFNDMTQQKNPVAKFLKKSKGDQCLLKYSDLLVRGRRLQRALHQDLPGQDLNHHLIIIIHYRHYQEQPSSTCSTPP